MSRFLPSTWQGLHPAFPAPEPPLKDDGATTWPSALVCTTAPVTLALGLWRPQLRRACANVTVAAFVAASLVKSVKSDDKQVYARQYLAEKDIIVPDRPWVNPSRQFLAGDARWIGGVVGAALCLLEARRASALKTSMVGRALVGSVYGSSIGLVGFTHTWPLLFRTRYEEWRAATEAKEKEAETWTQDVEETVMRHRFKRRVAQGDAPIDLTSPLVGNKVEMFLPEHELEDALHLYEKPPPARKINQGVGPHYTAKEYGELDPVPVPCTDYTWIASTPREKVESQVASYIAKSKARREQLLSEKKLVGEWLACSELEYYKAFESATSGRQNALDDDKVLEYLRYCQGLSATNHTLHSAVADIEWMIASSESMIERVEEARSLDIRVWDPAWGGCLALSAAEVVPERTLALLVERKKKLEYLEEHYKQLEPALWLSMSDFAEKGETPRQAWEMKRKDAKVQQATKIHNKVVEHRKAADRLVAHCQGHSGPGR